MKLDVLQPAAAEKPWYADGLTFTCQQCGNCCTGGPGYVWISDEEIDRMARFLKLSRQQVVTRYCRRIGQRVSLNEKRTPQGLYDCVFLQEVKLGNGQVKRICTVYDIRPLQCRTWPFWEGVLDNPQRWSEAAKRCHGINHGSRRFALAEIEALRNATDWPDNPPTSHPSPKRRPAKATTTRLRAGSTK
jgi:Fe-S-cluster containining protein